MGRGKIVLLFQAVVTLVIGMIFFAQFLAIDHAKIEELKVEINRGHVIWEDDAPR